MVGIAYVPIEPQSFSFIVVTHRRIRLGPGGIPVAGEYDLVVDVRIAQLIQAAQAAGIEVATQTLCRRDGRLIAREIATGVLDAIEARINTAEEVTSEQMSLVNRLIRLTQDEPEAGADGLDELLPLVLRRVGPAGDKSPADLSDHGLLTGREGTHSLVVQLQRELASCDRVDWLVSFVKLSAVRMLQPDIEDFLARGGSMRLVTTAYMGATEPRALEALAAISRDHGSRLQIRFSCETSSTRLHAKAYIHHRQTGFGNAYIGSANLSQPALTEGLEWVVRLSQAASPGLWTKIEETFDQWWEDPEFEEYAVLDGHPSQQRFRDLIAAQHQGSVPGIESRDSLPIFDLSPKPFQQAILERVSVERDELGYRRHLVVAATGTGKTMIAAFDFRAFSERFRTVEHRVPRLLYVAHTERILAQARQSFAQVMRDLNFGGLLVGGRDDRPCNHLFASIQSWNSRIGTDSVASDFWDYVVIDEVHHGEAPSWQRLLSWVSPKSLIGLTATPERADGLDIRRHFEDRITAEIRLPDAIGRRLLVPFRYFGVSDDIDLRGLRYTKSRGYSRAMQEVENVYLLAGEGWIEGVRRAIWKYVSDPCAMRAIGFCSGVAHASAMHAAFERLRLNEESRDSVGLRTAVLSGEDSIEERERVLRALRRGELQVVFAADLLNEGVDIPEVDTVLFMRPTESLTVFLQQLGRGLRLSPTSGKDCLVVLDFVGQYHRQFRIEDRYAALLTGPKESVGDQVRNGFNELPAGCTITLEPVARQRVLDHIAAHTGTVAETLLEMIRTLQERLGRVPTLREFLAESRIEPRTLYGATGRSWTALTQRLSGDASGNFEVLDQATPALRALASLTDRVTAREGLRLISLMERGTINAGGGITSPAWEVLLVEFGRAARSVLQLDRVAMLGDAIKLLEFDVGLREEIKALLDALSVRPSGLTPPGNHPMPDDVPLRLHHAYSRKQLLAAWGWDGAWRTTLMSGVHWSEQHRAYIMLVTLEKDHQSFTERTRYRDYAISPKIFHWQSQSTAVPDRGDGRRVVAAKNGEATMWLFLRRSTEDAFGSEPFVFMGAFKPTKIEGERPMSVTGVLADALPPEWFEIAARAR